MNRIAIDTSVFAEIEAGDFRAALTSENDRFRRAVVENDETAKLDNQDEPRVDPLPKEKAGDTP